MIKHQIKIVLEDWKKRGERLHELGIYTGSLEESEKLLSVSETYFNCIDEIKNIINKI